MAFIKPFPQLARATNSSLNGTALKCNRCLSSAVNNGHRRSVASMSVSKKDEAPEDFSVQEELAKIENMRRRLEGLFGPEESDMYEISRESFDGTALRKAIINRWGVQYDVQPIKFHNRVYVQVMWRYFEQQSFYMDEDEFASHCEAIAILLKRWEAVDYFLDYISNIKKRPVVGITINVPIPGIEAADTQFEV